MSRGNAWPGGARATSAYSPAWSKCRVCSPLFTAAPLVSYEPNLHFQPKIKSVHRSRDRLDIRWTVVEREQRLIRLQPSNSSCWKWQSGNFAEDTEDFDSCLVLFLEQLDILQFVWVLRAKILCLQRVESNDRNQLMQFCSKYSSFNLQLSI